MTYSSGINGGSDGLMQSQFNKIDRIISKARLNKDSLVLEIGCGWVCNRKKETMEIMDLMF